MSFAPKKASKSQQKLRLAISGPSGTGKTWSALLLAKSLGLKRTCVLDTEKGSASLYADNFNFDVVEFEEPHTPQRYIEAIKHIDSLGYDCIVLDSISPEWKACLDLHSKIPGNSFIAWGKITPLHEQFIAAMLNTSCHLIVTMRSKTAYVIETDANGKNVPKKVGLDPQQRDFIEYEFTSVFELNHQHNFIASKDRTSLFGGDIPQPLDESVGKKLLAWLNSGEKVSFSPEIISPTPEPAVTVIVPTVQDQANALSAALDAIETLDDVKAVEQGFKELKPSLSPKALDFLQLKLNKARAKVENF